MSEIIKVGMADLKVCRAPDALTTLGLGSCVGVALLDPVTRIGGLVHIMLPDSNALRGEQTNLAKFANTGIEELIKHMEFRGAQKRRMTAKLAGGATMFKTTGNSTIGNVGIRNAEACKRFLQLNNIPILAEDCGANYGRTVIFYPENGEYHVKAVGKDLRII